MTAPDCPICAAGRPLDVVVELAETWVTLPRRQALPGYVCVVAKRHVREPYELPDIERRAFWATVDQVARVLDAELRPRTLNYELHGNTIEHLHVHLFPRTPGDRFEGRPIDGGDAIDRDADEADRLSAVLRLALPTGRAQADVGLGLVVGADHVQLAIPAGGEDRARQFYGEILGLREVEKPPELAGRGGCWFVGPGLDIHCGVEEPFQPARKAHPAFLVGDIDVARSRLVDAGIPITQDDSSVSIRRFYIEDPFGNRLEIVDERDRGFTGRQPQKNAMD